MIRPITECPLWRWMPGMRGIRPGPWAYPDSYRVPECIPNGGVAGYEPDPNDPATAGCLLALVREAWGLRDTYVTADSEALNGWTVYQNGIEPAEIASGATEWDALCAALWAASERAP